MLRALGQSQATLAGISQGQLPRLKRPFKVRSFRELAGKLSRQPFWFMLPPGGKPSLRGGIRRWFMRTRALDWIFAGTTVSSTDSSMMGKNTRVFYIHNRDYEYVLGLSPLPFDQCRNAVLLDHMGFHHPDAQTLGIKLPQLDEGAFFASIRHALDSYEEHSGLTVEVAAHPRALPGSLDQYYGNRLVRYGETPDAIAGAKVVIVINATTAVGLAVALNRPMIALVGNTFWSVITNQVETLSELLLIPVVDIDPVTPQWPELSINLLEYEDYMRKYVKIPGTIEERFWKVVTSHIQVPIVHS